MLAATPGALKPSLVEALALVVVCSEREEPFSGWRRFYAGGVEDLAVVEVGSCEAYG